MLVERTATECTPPAVDYGALDETALVALAIQRNERAIRLLIKRHNQRLFRAARSIAGNNTEAEDIVQASYVRAFTHLDGFRGESSMATWLTRITVNEALGRLRKRPRMDAVENLKAEVETSASIEREPSPEEETSRREVSLLLERTVDRLQPDFRSVFVLREVEGWSVEETADFLAIPAETVKSRLRRARLELRSHLEQQLAGGFTALYPFDGKRCTSMADKVIASLGRS